MTNFVNDNLPYQKIKELDLESEKKLTEGSGPADECICHILAPPEQEGRGGLKGSIKRAFRTMSGSVKRRQPMGGGGGWGGRGQDKSGLCVNPSCEGNVMGTGGGVFIPLTTEKGGKGIYTTKETLKRTKPCGGRCGCDKENIVMKHSYANIKIISPDVSSICPCPNSCLNTEALNNIKVTVERLELHPDTTDSEASVSSMPPRLPEPVIEKRPVSELIDAQYDDGTVPVLEDAPTVIEQEKEEDDVSEWSFGIMVGEESQEEESEEDKPVSDTEPSSAEDRTTPETIQSPETIPPQ